MWPRDTENHLLLIIASQGLAFLMFLSPQEIWTHLSMMSSWADTFTKNTGKRWTGYPDDVLRPNQCSWEYKHHVWCILYLMKEMFITPCNLPQPEPETCVFVFSHMSSRMSWDFWSYAQQDDPVVGLCSLYELYLWICWPCPWSVHLFGVKNIS